MSEYIICVDRKQEGNVGIAWILEGGDLGETSAHTVASVPKEDRIHNLGIRLAQEFKKTTEARWYNEGSKIYTDYPEMTRYDELNRTEHWKRVTNLHQILSSAFRDEMRR